MGMLSSIISFALCAIVYVRMLKREVPEPMSKSRPGFRSRSASSGRSSPLSSLSDSAC